MTMSLELSPETAAKLVVSARERGVEPETYAGHLIEEMFAAETSAGAGQNVERFHAMLAALQVSSDGMPTLETASFSRESFYQGRG